MDKSSPNKTAIDEINTGRAMRILCAKSNISTTSLNKTTAPSSE